MGNYCIPVYKLLKQLQTQLEQKSRIIKLLEKSHFHKSVNLIIVMLNMH